MKLPNVPAILRGIIKAAFLRYCWHHELAGTSYDPEVMAKGIMLERLEIGRAGGMEAAVSLDLDNPFRVLLDSFARLALVGAENYVEFNLTWVTREEGKEDIPCTVTVQRTKGMTPHEARRKAESKLAASEHAVRDLTKALEAYEQQVLGFEKKESRAQAELEAARKTIADMETTRRVLIKEREEHERNCEEASRSLLETRRTNADLGLALTDALTRIDALEDLIQHWHVYLNYKGAAPEQLTEPQRELFAEVWAKYHPAPEGQEG